MSQPQLQPPQWLHGTEGGTQTAPSAHSQPSPTQTMHPAKNPFVPHTPRPLLLPGGLQVLSYSPNTPYGRSHNHHRLLLPHCAPSSSMSCSHSMFCPPGPQCPPPRPPIPRCGPERREGGDGGARYSKQDRLKNKTRQGQRLGPRRRKRGLLPPSPERDGQGPAPPSGPRETGAGTGTVPGGHKHRGATGSCTTA